MQEKNVLMNCRRKQRPQQFVKPYEIHPPTIRTVEYSLHDSSKSHKWQKVQEKEKRTINSKDKNSVVGNLETS